MGKTGKILSCTLGFIALSMICKTLTLDFDDKNLQKPAPIGSSWDTSELPTSTPLPEMLNQPYHFLGKGHQAFAFLSEDGNYVLKLFKPHYPHLKIFGYKVDFTPIPFAKSLYRFLEQEKFQKKTDKDFRSYINAFSLFKEESQLEYLHLSTTSNLNTILQISDPMNNPRHFNADKTCFLIQRRVDPFILTLGKWIEQGHLEQAKDALSQMAQLLAKRIDLGFIKSTNKIYANFGFIGSRVIQLDIGRLLTAKDRGSPPSTTQPYDVLHTSTYRLKNWLNKQSPELSNYFTQCIDDLIAGKAIENPS